MVPRGVARAAGLAALVLASFSACRDRSVLGPPSGAPASLSFHVSAPAYVRMLTLTVSGPGIDSSLVFNLPVVNDTANGTIQVPAGSRRHLTAEAFDAAGLNTHRADTTLTLLPGANPPVTLVLLSLTGDVPVTVTFGGTTIVLTPGDTTIHVEDSVVFVAAITDQSGRTLAGVRPRWATSNPGIASIDTLTGVVHGLHAGTVSIVAVYGPASASTAVTVTDPFADTTYYQTYLGQLYAELATSSSPGIPGVDAGLSQYLRMWWNLQELPTDEAVLAWSDPGVADLNTQTWTSASVAVLAMYERIYIQVGMANYFLRQTTDEKLAARRVASALRATIQAYRAEARFLRALSYWHGIDLFGSIPLVTEADPSGAAGAQVPRDSLYRYVVGELSAIKASLPARGAAAYGHASSDAVNMLLAELYLNAGVYTGTPDWAHALSAAQAVIGAGYTIDRSYAHLFQADNNTSPEIVFAVPQDGVIGTPNWGGVTYLIHAAVGGSMTAADYGIDYGWAGLRVRPEYYALFWAGDGRASAFDTVGQTIAVTSITTFTNGIAYPKFTNRTSTGANGSNLTYVDTDFPMFRLAEAYLIYAEANVRGGGGSAVQALSYVNALRERAYDGVSGDVPADSLNPSFLLAERGRELGWEAHRRTDLVRFGAFTGSGYVWAWKGGLLGGASTASYLNLYPLPASVLAANPTLTQNPGY